MEVLEIRYETGCLWINVPAYFPCTQANARKLFPLIRRYCTAEDRTELDGYLHGFCKSLRSQMEKRSGQPGKSERQTLCKRAEGNYGLYCRLVGEGR